MRPILWTVVLTGLWACGSSSPESSGSTPSPVDTATTTVGPAGPAGPAGEGAVWIDSNGTVMPFYGNPAQLATTTVVMIDANQYVWSVSSNTPVPRIIYPAVTIKQLYFEDSQCATTPYLYSSPGITVGVFGYELDSGDGVSVSAPDPYVVPYGTAPAPMTTFLSAIDISGGQPYICGTFGDGPFSAAGLYPQTAMSAIEYPRLPGTPPYTYQASP